jgi:hypothetical protein
MAKYQVGRESAALDVERIVLFLKTLDGDTGESE